MSEFEGWKSVWGHIEDLRQTFIRMGCILAVGFLLALAIHSSLFHLLTQGWNGSNSSLAKQIIQHERMVNRSSQPVIYSLPEGAMVRQEEGVEWIGQQQVRLRPGQEVDYEVALSRQLLILGPLDGILLTFKVCFWLSVALTSPLWGWVLLQFVLPGLKHAERAVLVAFTCWSFLWMGGGIALAYFATIPLANRYLEGFNGTLGLNAWTLAEYLDYTLILFLGHVLAFELGFLLLCLVHFQCLRADWLIAKRRYMIVLAFILGALLTPPDVLTQFMLALPLIGLYELSILYAKWKGQKIISL